MTEELQKITGVLERILGNEMLSPYRLKNVEEESKTIFEPKDII